MNRPFQAVPPATIFLSKQAFAPNNETALYWITSAGLFINSYGTTVLIDPNIALKSTDPPISEVSGLEQMTMPPFLASDIEKLDAVLLTHADDDHLGECSIPGLVHTGATFHGTAIVCEKLRGMGIPEDQICEHPYKDTFSIGTLDVEMTPAYHPWQKGRPNKDYVYVLEDCCGYKLHTKDGVIWNTGDTLLLDEHLTYDDVDVMALDFSDDSKDQYSCAHFGRQNAVNLANHLKKADKIIYHWGTYYAPDKSWISCNPADILPHIEDPSKFLILAPGQKYVVHRQK